MRRLLPYAIAAIAIAEAIRARRAAERESRLTDQFCFDSFAFSKLWRDELDARHAREEASFGLRIITTDEQERF